MNEKNLKYMGKNRGTEHENGYQLEEYYCDMGICNNCKTEIGTPGNPDSCEVWGWSGCPGILTKSTFIFYKNGGEHNE